MKEIIERLSKIEHGFKPIEVEAKKIYSLKPSKECLVIAKELYRNDIYQVRALGVFILGYIASEEPAALQYLKTKVSHDPSWQVQEILAKAFDNFCNNIGYEKALPNIKEWLADENHNVCRAVTEGLRIWTSRPYFKSNPLAAIKLISQHKAHKSEYLRRSVGNSLRDISKRHKELVEKELSSWDLSDKGILLTYKLATKVK